MSQQPSASGTSERRSAACQRGPEAQGHDLWQGFFEEASDPIFTLDPAGGTITNANQAASSVLGYARDELAGMPIGQVVPRFTDAPAWAELTEALEAGGSEILELTYRRRDGSTLPMEIQARLIRLRDGDDFVLQVARDIAEQKRTEEALKVSQEYANNILESSLDIIIAVGNDRRVIEFNRAAEESFGYGREEVLGRHVQMLYARGHEHDMVHEQTLLRGRMLTEISNRRKNGEEFPCLLASSILRDAEGRQIGVMGISRDISERKQTERALRESQEYAQSILLSSLDMIIAVDNDRHIIEFNAAAEECFGHTRDEVIGKHVSMLYADADDHSWVHRLTRLEGRLVTEVRNRKKSGDEFPALLASSCLRDLDGVEIGVMGISRDITEQKLAEEALQAALREKEILLRELHHRVKNNLQVISGLFFLQSRATKDEEARRTLQEAENRIHALGLIHEKLFQRRNLDRIDFGTYVRELMDNLLVAYSLDAQDIDLVVRAKEVSLGVEKAIPCALLLNELVSNALKHAFPDGRDGEIRVVFDREEDLGRYRLVVRDNGIGPPDGFDLRSGRSVGLQIVRLLTEQMRAEVLVETEGGLGVTVTFE